MDFIEDLKWRGLIKEISNADKLLKAQKKHRAVYCGFDPTATSLHVGHLIPLVMLERSRRAGFESIALIGGGTAMIGDPSFKAQERALLSAQTVKTNIEAIEKQIRHLLPEANILNNNQWIAPLSLVDYLREIGKDFNLAYLLAKETIASRIQNGLSITEFLYTTLQANDFYQLYEKHNCYVEFGGSDQWGNITSGLDYINTRLGNVNNEAAAFTIPLLTKKDGQKFGKTESGAIWLDANKTNEYEFYQFWLNQTDEDAYRFIKFFTFLDRFFINKLKVQSEENPKQRLLQKTLAREMTVFVHGTKGLEKAETLTNAFFHGTVGDLNDDLLKIAFSSLTVDDVSPDDDIWKLLITTGAATSKREAREFLQASAIQINDQVIKDGDQKVSQFKLLASQYLLIKRGKRRYYLARVV